MICDDTTLLIRRSAEAFSRFSRGRAHLGIPTLPITRVTREFPYFLLVDRATPSRPVKSSACTVRRNGELSRSGKSYAARAMYRRFSALTAAVVVGLATHDAAAKSDAEVRVRGGARIEASATTNASGTELRGTLRDDAGRPVRDARVRVRWVTAAGARLLPRATSCASDGRPIAANEAEQAVGETDSAGHFCVRWPLELPEGSFSLTYDDERGLLDSLADTVAIDREPPVMLAYSPAPSVFAAEAGPASVVVEARGRAGAPFSLKLAWVSVDKVTTELARGELGAGAATRLSFSPVALGAPGNGELVAFTELSGRRIECRTPVTLSARARLESPSAATTHADGSAELTVAVTSLFGAVPSGSVEAIMKGRTIGIAPVIAGKAELPLRAEQNPGRFDVTLRYLSAAPFWVPDRELTLSLEIPRPSPWRWSPWAVGLLAIGAYLLMGWRRPARREVAKQESHEVPVDRASLAWVAPSRGTGWLGRVGDAHDGAPVKGARVVVLSGAETLDEAVTDELGEFRLALTPNTETQRATIRIEATWHSSLEKPLPPPGQLVISLLTRRRALLAGLVEWAERQGRPFAVEREPTPGDVQHAATESAEPAVAMWARGVEDAAFGPQPVDADREAGVRAQEPKR